MHLRYCYQAGVPYGTGGSFAGYAYVVNSVAVGKNKIPFYSNSGLEALLETPTIVRVVGYAVLFFIE